MSSQHENRTNILKALSFKWSMEPKGPLWLLTSPKGQRFMVEADSIGMPALTPEALQALSDSSGDRTGQYPTQTFTNPRHTQPPSP